MDDIVTITLLGSSLDNRVPSSEIALHLRAYQRRPDCNAIIHAHPLTATSMSLSGQKIPENALPEAGYVLGPVAYLDFAYPGTAEVPDSIERTIETHKTFLLSHHGAMTLGRDLWDACDRMETLERVAIMVREALSFGPIIGMPEMAHNRLKQEGLHGRLDS